MVMHSFSHMVFRRISSWRPIIAVQMEGMFQFASSYNSSLCAWGPQMVTSADVTNMFKGTQCPAEYLTPSLVDNPLGPMCGYCPVQSTAPAFQTAHNLVEGPFTLPLVPAAVTQLQDNVILAWAGDEMLSFDNGARRPGTYTCKFNLVTKNTTLLRVESTCQCDARMSSRSSHLLTTSFYLAPLPHADTVRANRSFGNAQCLRSLAHVRARSESSNVLPWNVNSRRRQSSYNRWTL
jgi:hypothetical protein